MNIYTRIFTANMRVYFFVILLFFLRICVKMSGSSRKRLDLLCFVQYSYTQLPDILCKMSK